MKKTIIAIVAIILLASCGGGSGTSTLKGTIRESSKKNPIESATVRIGDSETKTDRNGEFKLENITSGKVSILISADGYKPFEFGGYEIKEGDNTIEEILLEKDNKVVKDPDSGKIIEAPPLPGTPLKEKPVFKKFDKFNNCAVTISTGTINNGGSNNRTFKYYNGITKMENPMQMQGLIRDPNIPSPDVYITKDKMIINAGKLGWISNPLPKPDPNNKYAGEFDSVVKFDIDLIAKMLADKKSSLNYIGTTKGEYGEMKRYYLVGEDDNTNLVDGEILVPTSGEFKDYVMKFTGRLLVGGAGDKTDLTITQVGKVSPIELPKNIKEAPAPEITPATSPKPIPPKQP